MYFLNFSKFVKFAERKKYVELTFNDQIQAKLAMHCSVTISANRKWGLHGSLYQEMHVYL